MRKKNKINLIKKKKPTQPSLPPNAKLSYEKTRELIIEIVAIN